MSEFLEIKEKITRREIAIEKLKLRLKSVVINNQVAALKKATLIAALPDGQKQSRHGGTGSRKRYAEQQLLNTMLTTNNVEVKQ